MKKFLLILLVIAVAITVAACTKNKQKEKTTSLPDISNNGSDYAEEYSGIVSDTDFYTISPEDTVPLDDEDSGSTTKKSGSSETTTKKGSSQTTTKKGSDSTTSEKSDDGSFTTPIIPMD